MRTPDAALSTVTPQRELPRPAAERRIETRSDAADIDGLSQILLESMSDGFYAIDANWRFIAFNPTAERFFDKCASDVLDRIVWDVFPAAIGSEFYKRFHILMSGGRASTFESRSIARPGRILEVRAAPLRKGGLAVTFSDITARKSAEKVLRESEARFRTATDSSPALMWMTDAKGEVIFANRQYRTFFGVESDRMLGAGWRSIVHPDDVDSFFLSFQAALARRDPFHRTVRVIHPILGIRWLSCDASPRYGEDRTFLGYVGTNIDVTEGIVAEMALRENEARMRIALDLGLMGDWTWDAETDLVSLSDPARRIFGFDTDVRLTWREMQDRLHPEDAPTAAQAVDDAITHRTDYAATYRVRRADGRQIWISARGRPSYREDGRPAGMSGFVRDVTEQQESDQHRRLLVDELNHRVKNTLAVVQALAHQTFRGQDATARQAFEGRLATLAETHNLLTAQSWEAADIGDVVRGALLPHTTVDRTHVAGPRVQLAPKTAIAVALAVHELATNAVKYGALSVEQGRVSVVWDYRQSPEARLHLTWAETGGPPVCPPARRGFGLRMIEKALPNELRGHVHADFRPTGLVFSLEADLAVHHSLHHVPGTST